MIQRGDSPRKRCVMAVLPGHAHGEDTVGWNPAGFAEAAGMMVDTVHDEPLKFIQAISRVCVVNSGQNIGADNCLGIVKGGFTQIFSGSKIQQTEHYPGGSEIHGDARGRQVIICRQGVNKNIIVAISEQDALDFPFGCP